MQHHLRRPARAGLDDATVKLVQDYDNILYISCNPETLQANMAVLGETHEIARFALFDQFPDSPYGSRRLSQT